MEDAHVIGQKLKLSKGVSISFHIHM
jgi:hypothetical protein